mgnify:FL=1
MLFDLITGDRGFFIGFDSPYQHDPPSDRMLQAFHGDKFAALPSDRESGSGTDDLSAAQLRGQGPKLHGQEHRVPGQDVQPDPEELDDAPARRHPSRVVGRRRQVDRPALRSPDKE